MAAIQIKIVNKSKVTLRGNGAPPSMRVIDIYGEQDNELKDSSTNFDDLADGDNEPPPGNITRRDSAQSEGSSEDLDVN
ncbi:unnamed protein product [Allacma fusca]|uniref:Uncharacterized protein n=1 Tax=Allacma fusca TaxID=39272 RepID=A0A8J2PR83_9HEXA|nr:unnamed protein product [Allacma fusca]